MNLRDFRYKREDKVSWNFKFIFWNSEKIVEVHPTQIEINLAKLPSRLKILKLL